MVGNVTHGHRKLRNFQLPSLMLRGVSSDSSVCQLSQSRRLQCSIRRLEPLSISTVAIAAWRQERHKEGSIRRTMRNLVSSFFM